MATMIDEAIAICQGRLPASRLTVDHLETVRQELNRTRAELATTRSVLDACRASHAELQQAVTDIAQSQDEAARHLRLVRP